MEFFKRILGLQADDTTRNIVDLANTIILDVRTAEEYQSGHLKGARNIDFLSSDFKDQLSSLDKNKKYVLYCRSGNRSGQASYIMKKMGFPNSENLGSLAQAGKKMGIPTE